MTGDIDPVRTGDGVRRLLRCDACGRAVEVSLAEAVGYTRAGWPRCCGQVMVLFVAAGPPASSDTVPDIPPLPPPSPG